MVDLGKFISADGHVMEPADLWTSRMDSRFRGRAPYVKAGADADYLYIEGLPPFSGTDLIGGMANEKAAGKAIDNREHNRYSDMRAGALDPVARLSDQDLDHVSAEVVYPNAGMFVYAAPDLEYRRECLRAYNSWIAEYCSVAPDRIIGVAMLPVGEPEWALQEAERVRKLNIRSVLLPSDLPKIPYGDERNSRLWSGLQDLGMIVAFHNAATENFRADAFPNEAGGTMAHTVSLKIAGQVRTLGSLIASGVPHAFPKLRFVIVEGGIGWVAAVLRLMDHWWEDHHRWMKPELDHPPSYYCWRQVHFTFEDDRAGLMTLPVLNPDNLMWGSDYPHTEGTFPHSKEQIAKDFAQLPAEITGKIVAGNARRLYGLN